MHHTWGKPDKNQAAIVAALRQIGVSVLLLSPLGVGAPDLLCSYRGRLTLVELKTPGGKLRPSQVRWAATWDPYVTIHVVETIDQAITAATGRD